MFVAILMVAPADGASATLFALPIAALVGLVISQIKEERPFLFRLFVSAFLVRVLIGTLIYGLRLQEFFGGDALTYDYFGHALVQVWNGNKSYQGAIDVFSGGGAASGWGMLYMLGASSMIIGRNMFPAQFPNSIPAS